MLKLENKNYKKNLRKYLIFEKIISYKIISSYL